MTTILTLELDPVTQTHFESLRREHFPPTLNKIPAHITLFHTLPDAPEVEEALTEVSSTTEAFPIEVTGLRSLGKGVAYTLSSSPMKALHKALAEQFAPHLSPQDRQPFHPHIVVQNKTTPEAARALLAQLQTSFSPMTGQALGLTLWEYLGGPWRHHASYPFQIRSSAPPTVPGETAQD